MFLPEGSSFILGVSPQFKKSISHSGWGTTNKTLGFWGNKTVQNFVLTSNGCIFTLET